MKEKVYIAGKITGDPDFYPKFKGTEEYFKSEGYTVLNPAELPPGMSPGDYMRVCLAMVDTADIVYFMPSYTDSAGAFIELKYAQYIGKHIMYGETYDDRNTIIRLKEKDTVIELKELAVARDPMTFDVRIKTELIIDRCDFISIKDYEEAERIIAERITDELLKELKRSDI